MLVAQKTTQKSVITINKTKRAWTQTEQDKFKHLYKQFKRDFKRYVPYFDGRTESQIKSFCQNVVHKNKMIQNSKCEQIDNISSKNVTQSSQNMFNQLTNVSNSQFELTTVTFDNLDDLQ
ncbi:SANT/Myb_domain [Hexamita inflata]|uniref:SANT/Myb domain n=1 Tax=Hexamita inflata TaxID=28002 RepID=A0AA86QB93_9EUKA|nr:SANT/Myb domain [Hexamita inflata]